MNEQRQQREAGLVRCLWESAWASMQTVRELQDRLVASRARQMFDMEVQVQGEIISDRGVRFLEEVGERLMRLMETCEYNRPISASRHTRVNC